MTTNVNTVSVDSPPLATPQLLSNTETRGIVDTSWVLRTAIMAGLEDIRQNPELINYALSNLFLIDPITNKDIRTTIINTAKDWILNSKISVVLYPKLDEVEFPCVTINILDSVEVENQLGDIHYKPSQEGNTVDPYLLGPITTSAYNVDTGEITLPASAGSIYSTERMAVIGTDGKEIPIVKSWYGSSIFIPPNTNPSLVNIISVGTASPNARTRLESARFLEKFTIGCFAQGEPSYTIYLNSIIMFVLLRYRENLLEARGYERTTVSNGALTSFSQFIEGKENVFGRNINISGYTNVVWPKYTSIVLNSVVTQVVAQVVGETPSNPVPGNILWTSK